MHKCLFGISDYCEFVCWNSCSCFSDMLGYANLLIIELLMMKLHVHDIYKWVLCEFCSNWWIVILCCWIVVEFMPKWSCCWIRYVVAAELYHGYSILWSHCLNWWSCAKLFMWRTKMNFWYIKLLTELSVLLGELNLVEFMFSCRGCVSRVVWEETGVSCENSIVNRFEKWVFVWGSGKWFRGGQNLNFSVHYDRAKCQERLGKNGIEKRLTVWFLCVKTWRLKIWCCLSSYGRATMRNQRATILIRILVFLILEKSCHDGRPTCHDSVRQETLKMQFSSIQLFPNLFISVGTLS